MANAGTVNVKFTAQTAAFEAGVKKVDGLIGGLGSSLKLISGLAAGFLAWKGTGFIKQTMQSIDATAKMADRIGVTTEAMVGLQHAGDLAGVSAEAMSKSIEKMGANLADAAVKATPTSKALESIGVTLAELQKLSPDQQMGRIADGLNSLGGAGARAAAAQDIFGKSGLELQQVLAGGSKSLEEARKEADALGISFSRLDAFKVEQANDALTRVGAAFKGGLTAAAIELSPVIEAISNSMIDAAKNAGGMGKITLSVLEKITEWVGVAGDAWNVLTAAWHAGSSVAYTVAAAWMKAGEFISSTVVAIMGGFRSLDNFVGSVFDNIIAANNVTAAWLKDKMGDAIHWVGVQFSTWLSQTAQSMRDLLPATSAQLQAASQEVLNGVNKMAAGTTKALATAQAELASTKNRIAESFSGIQTDTASHPLVQWFAQAGDGMVVAGQESAFAFTESFSAVINQEASAGIADWFAQIDALSAASAEASAVRVAARLEQDRVAGEEQVAMAEAREGYLSEMFGNQAEKRLAWDKQTLDQRLSYTSNILGNLSTLQNTSSRKMFEVGKIAAYANAVVSTAAGIARQFADLPIYAAIPAAIAVAAAGAVQIASIASTSFGGGGSVSSAGGSIPLVNGEPQGTQMANQGAVQPTTNTLNVQISGLDDDAMVSGRFVRNLIGQINEQQRDGSPIDRVDVRAA